MRKIIIVVLFLLFGNISIVFSQEIVNSAEMGFFIGGSYYIGDLNPTKHFVQTKPAFGVYYRYNFNYRCAFRTNLLYGGLKADDADAESIAQRQRNLNFETMIFEVSPMMEFNFMDYKIGNEKHQFSPYTFLGVGLFYFDPGVRVDGNLVKLRDLRTEGQSKKYKRFQMSIPFGAGIKLNVAKRLGLGIEWGLRKTFTDYIDDVSTTYASSSSMPSKTSAILSDKTTYNTSGLFDNTGRQRGNAQNKDWYSFVGITLNIKLNLGPEPCYTKY